MEIRHKGHWFFAFDSYSSHAHLKSRGWKFNSAPRFWSHNADVSAATYFAVRDFETHMDEGARARLLDMRIVTDTAIAASRATEATIEVPVPKGLSLTRYQKAGVEFLLDHPRAILADEAELGPRLEVIGVANTDLAVGNVLVVCPPGLKPTWHMDFARWGSRGWKTLVLTGMQPDVDLTTAQVVIADYGQLATAHASLSAVEWGMIILDDALDLKDKNTKRAVSAFGFSEVEAIAKLRRKYAPVSDWCVDFGVRDRQIRRLIVTKPELQAEFRSSIRLGLTAKRKIFVMTSPIPARPVDLFRILEQVDPDGLGDSYVKYGVRFCRGVQRSGYWDMQGASNLEELELRLRAACMLRRVKADLAKDPPQTAT
jgi:SWI/SNF-related matrix-associated actin-dependent regulator 1 of chromatin subfamily A